MTTLEERESALPAFFSGMRRHGDVYIVESHGHSDLLFDFEAGYVLGVTPAGGQVRVALTDLLRCQVDHRTDCSDNWDHDSFFLVLESRKHKLVYCEAYRLNSEFPSLEDLPRIQRTRENLAVLADGVTAKLRSQAN